ncbi:hypothetical protein DFH11DRAFT_1547392 [Phellopilus nigrolimitatus]|nr:hypothetical protein DFH11DRAFT_1547392 [Phellopilus nigrolimitatus]
MAYILNRVLLFFLLSVTHVALLSLLACAAPEFEPAPQATPTGISPLECLLPPDSVQCCQEVAPLVDLLAIVGPILAAAGIPLPPLGTIVALDCMPSLLGIGCTESALCCTLVVPGDFTTVLEIVLVLVFASISKEFKDAKELTCLCFGAYLS